ncbi:MAG: hypothetical protein R2932_41315 [Caldilineaceae bacterium]
MVTQTILMPTALMADSLRPTDPIWMSWTADHYALAEDNTAIWIGTGVGLVRYEKATDAYTRITVLDGFPHRHVYTIAVDNAGNRWFGGDAGLSWLDVDEQWHHETLANSTLTHAQIVALALGSDGVLWAGHGDGGGISRRGVDGVWQWYPHVSAVIAEDYSAILQTQSATDLWTIHNNEIWVDYAVYDGHQWVDRTPSGATGEMIDVVVDGNGRLWVLDDEPHIRWWNGQEWQTYQHEKIWSASSLVVDAAGTLWLAWSYRFESVFTYCAGYDRLFNTPDPESCQLAPHPPVVDLLVGAQGTWVLGEGWLAKPNGDTYLFSDIPPRHRLDQIFTDQIGNLWLLNMDEPEIWYSAHWLHTFNDGGTNSVDDDQLQEELSLYELLRLTTDSGGDFWVTWQTPSVAVPPYKIHRRHDEQWILYNSDDLPPGKPIYAQDTQHTWFLNSSSTLENSALYLLDDQGTPAETSDDSQTRYALPTTVEGRVVVDGLGRLWYGADKLYRYNGTTWQVIYDGNYGVEDLLAAPGGEVFAIFDVQNAVIVAKDDTTEIRSVQELLDTQAAWLYELDGHTRYWANAPDGSIWYMQPSFSGSRDLYRHTGDTRQHFGLPNAVYTTTTPIVDRYGHVWFRGQADSLWRLSLPSTVNLYLPFISR